VDPPLLKSGSVVINCEINVRFALFVKLIYGPSHFRLKRQDITASHCLTIQVRGEVGYLTSSCRFSAVVSGSWFPAGGDSARCAQGGTGSDRARAMGWFPGHRDEAASQADSGKVSTR
jgi:hypothetical protein